jgi:hypothetical protein
MSRHGEELLLKLFKEWESAPNDPRPATITISRHRALPYFQAERLDDKDALHAYLRLAEHEGCIQLTWGKLQTAHLLKRITLRDGVKLASYLGLPVATVEAEKARLELASVLSGKERWIDDLQEEIVGLWRVGEKAHGLTVQQLCEARELLRALEAVCAGKQDGLDLRTFSARYVGDSKAMERMQSRFSRIWQRQFTGDELDADELYQSLGLSKFPQPILLKGPITIESRAVRFDCSAVRPYIGFPPQAIENLAFPSLPSYVLFIENPASFNRHVAEIEDNGLVLYTAGFPSSRALSLYRLLDEKLPESVNFFHWGDLDLGGLRIMARIQKQLGRTLHPHLMTLDLLNRHGEAGKNLDSKKLTTLASRHPGVKPPVELILSFDPPKWLEQENVDPSSPLS